MGLSQPCLVNTYSTESIVPRVTPADSAIHVFHSGRRESILEPLREEARVAPWTCWVSLGVFRRRVHTTARGDFISAK